MNAEALEATLSVATVVVAGLALVLVVGSRTRALAPALVSYVTHLVLARALYETFGLWMPDATLYQRAATEMLAYWNRELVALPGFAAGKEGWPWLLAWLYGRLGVHVGVGLVVNAAACALLVCVVAATARRLDLPGTGAAWTATLLPPFALWGSVLLREAIVWLLLAILMYGATGLVRGGDARRDLPVTLLALGGLLVFRGSLAVVLGGAIMLGIAMARRGGGRRVVVAALLALLAALPLADRISAISGQYDLAQINASRLSLGSAANSSAFPVVAFTDPVSILTQLPQLLPRILFGPFPWEWSSMRAEFALEALCWLPVVALACRGWWLSADRRPLMVMLVPAGVLICVLALTSGNYGTMVRLRAQAAVLVLPLAGAALARLQRPRREDAAAQRQNALHVAVREPAEPTSLAPGARLR